MDAFRVSASQLTLYGICPRKYRYQYVEIRQPSELPSGLAFGSSIHAALEFATKRQMARGSVEQSQVIQVFEADFEAQREGEIPLVFKAYESFDEMLLLGRRLLPLALQELSKTTPAAIEEQFEVVIDGEQLDDETPIHLVGVLDRLEADGTIVELKTAKKRHSSLDLSQNLQLTAYSLAQFVRTNTLPTVRLLALLKTQVPEVVWFETRRTVQELAWFTRLVGETVRAIAEGFFPPRISWACLDCEHRQACSKEETRTRPLVPVQRKAQTARNNLVSIGG